LEKKTGTDIEVECKILLVRVEGQDTCRKNLGHLPRSLQTEVKIQKFVKNTKI
jgi:hypothetical protein